MKKIGPYSRPDSLKKLDGRSKEARLLKDVRSALVDHVGGAPSVTQLALIDRAAWLTLHMAMMDSHMLAGGAPAERDARQYLAWANTLTRTMRSLGLDKAPAVARGLDDLLAERRARV
ncbi:hypothetical protein [Acetobacter pasteurianus]|uniref:Uncharacterized protein n=1 Tax=Acetobacter pasteurianus (strain NBRC 105184 / IFO 3283-01) TaxID=634452 RepID=C7JH43_ACEP3|nr:hypothetical protein [Acetobacter pasteurianus]BAI00778.1 hypothetical protein APA01_26860 [Acetobacter pasteurianus IFO 3283-01]BAI03827.1 hypothetical protein APA03_26860 [Acetobacter pasteurianus IFO 3283-03]BAI06874.1 hypothetical protein APA07_26860 [Acetobacter pasteurianus IFO 3283-07]BAI09922.1 hypothetical protein APA22_26860 [Acetobacter pasteurianus IFO 3283-22]BAI12970.1 hypothetical protein APA26_26860 [Acetobacter pasteurianus IFO 3283-26]